MNEPKESSDESDKCKHHIKEINTSEEKTLLKTIITQRKAITGHYLLWHGWKFSNSQTEAHERLKRVQQEKKIVFSNFPDLFEDIDTIMDTERIIKLKLGRYLLKPY